MEGVFNAVIETTYQVISERRTRVLRELGERTAAARSADEACALAASSLGSAAHDVPFCALYLVDETAQLARLAASSGLSRGGPAAPELIPLVEESAAPWPFSRVRRSGRAELVTGLSERFDASLPGGPWPEPADSALVAPLVTAAAARAAGFLVLGVSPRRAPDEEYRQFAEQAAAHITTVVSRATADEAERKRAEALAELDRAKTAFFSNVSHEFRTPLTLMLGPIEDGLSDTEQPLPPAQRERQELVRRNGLRLQKLVNTLLDFARIEAGRAQASFVPTDLAALTTDLASSFDSALGAAGLKMVVDCPALPEAVYVDPAMWEKVVLNLLSNAFKFTFKGEIRVFLQWLGERVELSVQDTGTGIPEEELPRIFERFFRVEGARGRSYEGTGIGLALVQELVKLHGGKVTVKSALGKGSTFTVSLPTGSAHLPRGSVRAARTLASTGVGPDSFLAEVPQWNEAESPSAAPRATPAPVNAAPSALHEGARILVADDNADMRKYLARLLSPHWTVEAVEDGAQAIAAAQASPPDLILSDVMMPGMDGLELVQALRADVRTRTIPVVLLSARAGEEATIEGLRSGADEYLIKPFSANELLARVNAQLTVSRLRQEAVRAERAHAAEATRLLEESRRATRAREETLAVVSHDLRSPLAAISTAAELLQRAFGDDAREARLRKHTGSIRRSITRMNRLIGDLLDLASIDSGTLSLTPQPHTAEELLHEVQEMFELRVREKGLQFTSELEPDLPVLPCDKERILQALANLLSNAVKFTAKGGVTLRAQRQPEGILFSVSDTGAGIAPEALPHVFDRYWHSAQKGRESHGLGLSIARGVVEAHGGTLRVESEPGRGTTFSFLLPTSPAARRAPTAPSEVTLHTEATAVSATTPQAARSSSLTYDFLAGGGEMGKLIRAMDWSKTPLGPVERWPQSLRTMVGLLLRNRFPLLLWWGPKLVQFYNDAYRPIPGSKHPNALGQAASECWAEIWHIIGPMIEAPFRGEPATSSDDLPLMIHRNGFLEETHFKVAYSPVPDETVTGTGIGGVLATVSEITAQVYAERQLRTLRELAVRAAEAKSAAEACENAVSTLAENPADVPFSVFYLLSDGARAVMTASSGFSAATEAARPSTLEIADDVWPLASAVAERRIQAIHDLRSRFDALPTGAWAEPPHSAMVLPLAAPDQERPYGVLIVGLSPHRMLDEGYRSFFELAAAQVVTAIRNARAYEEERARAEALAEVDRADTGVGIPEEELPRVFERFYRVRVTQGRSHEGTGIGLALVQELVKLHGGSVAAKSKLGEGTTFTVRMPRGSAHLPSDRVERTSRPRSSATHAVLFTEEARRWALPRTAVEAPRIEASAGTLPEVPGALSSARILLADDNADLRTYVSGLLGQVFRNVDTVADGRAALEAARTRRPDLILSDVMMPVLDGFGLVRELRADERTRAIPIILLSARAGDESSVEGLQSGADDYLVKPFSARELIARVRTQLEMVRVRREMARHEFSGEQLRATLKARDEWLTVVSHELRTPLSALALSVQSLLRSVAFEARTGLSPEEARMKAHTTTKHLHRLTRQVEQLVDVAELISGRLELAPEEVNLSGAVAAVIEEAREKAARLGCTVILSASTPVVVRYDRPRLHQLVESLLDNALKFGASRPVEVTVAEEASHALIRIVDHGDGIAPEDQERVFGRFERAAPIRNYGGFGLGLWRARHIAEAHAGSILLTRTEGGGATFTVVLPLP
ncbi:ATP-binding protein [Hyalangium sp.]|uniref:ATP-binding protein n=1 Tax=Hyalangium sp. TaxID=2028555 RepID=UPI002D3145B5|nr:ATP-binding protein [Hyalangium sp.]HYH95986.1 ATP-binding protein [Hyalangium sp.]